jgi:hypothetical protein
MSKSQEFPVSAPLAEDKASLNDFAATVQRNFEDLFTAAHTHDVKTAAPATNDGAVGDMVPVVISGVGYIYIKFPVLGWKRIALS